MAIADFKASVATLHPNYIVKSNSWKRIRDCMEGEDRIKAETTRYLPRPAGMSGDYADAYDAYIERAHFPLVTAYALSGALGLVVSKLPEVHVPKELEYLLTTATKDGKTMSQFFIDIVIEIFQTGRVPILIDFLPELNQFRFVQYSAEEFINWKIGYTNAGEQALTLGVIKEKVLTDIDAFSHETLDEFRVLSLDPESGDYTSQIYRDGYNLQTKVITRSLVEEVVPIVYGKPFRKIPMAIAGSIDTDFDTQPIPLISVANCAIQIYRKEADLANSEFLSCNPTLVIVGASNDEDLPNVVGSSVMMVIPNEAARVFYTVTDTAALTHVKDHIKDLYEEAIRHGVAILDARKGVEAAEALRIRQSTQSSTIYSIYMSAVEAITMCLEYICDWGGFSKEELKVDYPNTLNMGFPDAKVLESLFIGIETSTLPLQSLYRYLLDSSLLDQSISYDEYLLMLESNELKKVLKTMKLQRSEGDEFGNKSTDPEAEAVKTFTNQVKKDQSKSASSKTESEEKS